MNPPQLHRMSLDWLDLIWVLVRDKAERSLETETPPAHEIREQRDEVMALRQSWFPWGVDGDRCAIVGKQSLENSARDWKDYHGPVAGWGKAGMS